MKRARGERIEAADVSRSRALILRPRTDEPSGDIFFEEAGPSVPTIELVEEEGEEGIPRKRDKGKERIRVRGGGPRGPRKQSLKQEIVARLRVEKAQLRLDKKANAAAIRANQRDLNSLICRKKTAKQRRATAKARKARRRKSRK